jgi:CubicO group peptidase (beta-lactamase class C family)
MVAFETVIKEAISSQELPGCVLVSTSRDGTFSYTKAFGASSMESDSAAPLALDSIMWVASCTKLMTSVCAMQLVERGLLDLDESVYKHIPELERLPVLTGFEEGSGKPIEDKSTQPITLRMLLTHSSGLAHDAIHPKTLAWLAYHKRAPNSHGKLIERFSAPLVFEPGSGWAYGPSIDYAGLLVERITGLTLEAYMRQNLWEPLGIKDMTFHLHSRPDLRARMADMSVRDETGKVRWTGAPMTYQDGEGREVEDCFGGQGCFLSAEEYLKVLRAVLSTEEDERVLKKDTLEMFFKESLGKGSREALNAMLQDDFVRILL